jgi:hypothetical protein
MIEIIWKKIQMMQVSLFKESSAAQARHAAKKST